MNNKVYVYRDACGLAGWVAALFTVSVFTKLATAAIGVMRLRALLSVTEAKVESSALVQEGVLTSIASGDTLTWLVANIVFFAWLYRAAANARALGLDGPRQSPCWSYLNFIIPGWRLFMPFVFMRRLWRALAGESSGRVLAGLVVYAILFAATALAVDAVSVYAMNELVMPAIDGGSAEALDELRRGVLPAGYLKVQSACVVATSLAQLYMALFLRAFAMTVSTLQASRSAAGRASRAEQDSRDAPAPGFGWPGMRG